MLSAAGVSCLVGQLFGDETLLLALLGLLLLLCGGGGSGGSGDDDLVLFLKVLQRIAFRLGFARRLRSRALCESANNKKKKQILLYYNYRSPNIK